MSSFEHLFGIPKEDVRPLCVLTPFLTKPLINALDLKDRFRGNPYAGYHHPDFTFIETRMGPLFSGDAVLHLDEARCRNFLFIGACGSLDEKICPIGSLAVPFASYALESFSMLASGRVSFDFNIPACPDPAWSLSKFPSVQCASIGSIVLETAFAPVFRDKGITVLDMECASIFCAAQRIGVPVSALLYVTDIIGKTSPYGVSDGDNAAHIEHAQKQAAEMILSLAEKI